MIIVELENRQIRKKFDTFNKHHIEYQPYLDKIYSTCFPNGNIKVSTVSSKYKAKELRDQYYTDNEYFYTVATPSIGWDNAKELRDHCYFDQIYPYIQCYVAANYITSNDCRVLIEASKGINEACTIMTILTNRLKLYLKPI